MTNIIMLGLVSFFMDLSAEMVYPLIPLYLSAVFGSTPALVGVVEGIAESTASLLKVFSGYLTDKYQRKKPLAFLGYAAGLVYKVALLLSSSWTGVLAARVTDRLGKGIRTTPRDVMVSDSAEEGNLGGAFGVHKALDMLGAALGILLAYLLLRGLGGGSGAYRRIFLLSMVPAALSLMMFLFIKEKRVAREAKKRERFWKQARLLDRPLKLYLLIALLFTLGNSSNTFLLLRARAAGFDDVNVILLYFLYNLSASLLAIPFGRLSDRVGRKALLLGGYLVFSLVYFGFAFAKEAWLLVALFALYGLYTAMTAGVERALIAEISPPALKGTMLGLHATLVGVALLPASLVFGLLWTSFGPQVPFVFGASLALLSALPLLMFFKPAGKPAQP
ncbi:MAG: MFS transporter [Clostridiales bacterium]|nr:MFS transporter [Clostridiales bacterium]